MTIARLILEDGSIFQGKLFSKGASCFGELIFNTSMTGYEEVLTDPSYKEQLVLFTYPQIGNYGIHHDNPQSEKPHLQAVIVKEYCHFPSHSQSKESLAAYLERHNIMGIEDIDTRFITRKLRHVGAMNALITDSDESDDILVQQVKNYAGLTGKNLAIEVGTKTQYQWAAPESKKFKVAVIDCGVKYSILNHLKALGCQCTVLPYTVTPNSLLNGDYDGVLISNGPGDPRPIQEAINLVKTIMGKIPVFGICLGHQIISLAAGMNLVKLPFGHHGVNHPIKNLFTNKIEITSQNHIYNTEESSIPGNFSVSHINLNDHTVAGVRSDELMIFSVQYHPESAPGPNDSNYLFEDFIYLMEHKVFKEQKQLAIQ